MGYADRGAIPVLRGTGAAAKAFLNASLVSHLMQWYTMTAEQAERLAVRGRPPAAAAAAAVPRCRRRNAADVPCCALRTLPGNACAGALRPQPPGPRHDRRGLRRRR